MNIGRIFVAPEHFRKGYGSFMMQEIESMFTGVKEFTLDTPDWNIRTNSFYTKLGYTETKRERGLVCYSKRKADEYGVVSFQHIDTVTAQERGLLREENCK